MKHDEMLDAQGLYCPEPVMMLHAKIDDMNENAVLLVQATDPSTTRDIPKFCQFLGHELMAQEEVEGIFNYWIKKKPD